MRRHLAVLTRLTGSSSSEVLVVAQSWSAATEAAELDLQIATILEWAPGATLPTDPDGDDDDTRTHLWLAQVSTAAPELVDVLMLAADDKARLLLFNHSLSWLYASYDGDANVILSDPNGVAPLREQFRERLPRHPEGL